MDFERTKGQSAIEYLTTYGWMLLVIAIVGGVIFTTIQDQTSNQAVSGQSSQGVIIDQIGINSNDNLEMELRAQTTEEAEEIDVTVFSEDGTNSSTKEIGLIAIGDTATIEYPNFNRSATQQELDVQFVYTEGEIERQNNASVTGQFEWTGDAS